MKQPPQREVMRVIDVRGPRGGRLLACVLSCGHWITRRARPPRNWGVACIGCVVEDDMAMAKSAEITVTGSTSDGYHTFDELYEHRTTLFIALCSEIDARTETGYVWRSKKHSDGSMFDGWFIMGIGTLPGSQITYHLPMSRWSDTDWLGTERPTAPEFDGHSASDVLTRLRRFFQS